MTENLVDCLSKLDLNENSGEDEYEQMVSKLRSKDNFLQKCIAEQDMLRKCLLCKYYLSSNEWSLLLEKHIKSLYKISKKKNNTSGDGCFNNKYNVEIKVSLGTKNSTMNFVQLRPDHDIDYYILLAYDVHADKYGKIYWFLCRSEDIYKLLPKYGSYAHGSKEKLGSINSDNIKGRNCEYALRPSPYKNGKAQELWNLMIESFQTTEEEIKSILLV